MRTISFIILAIIFLICLKTYFYIKDGIERSKRKFASACKSLDDMQTGTEYDLFNQKIYDELYSDEEYTEGLYVNCFGRLTKEFKSHNSF